MFSNFIKMAAVWEIVITRFTVVTYQCLCKVWLQLKANLINFTFKKICITVYKSLG
jgi:hypothetical protein